MNAELLLSLKVSPKASRNAIGAWHDGALKVSVTAAPENAKANQAVLKLLADTLDLPVSALRVVRGGAQRNKLIAISAPEQVLERLPPRSAGT